MTPDWFISFFSGEALQLWREAMTPEITEQEAEFLAATCARDPGAALLDVPCGNGRLSLALARRGFRVTGVDVSAEFVAEANREAAGQGLELRVQQGDMRRLPWPAAFDGAFCVGNSFGYFDRAGTADFIAAVAATLKPGGRFVLDTMMAAESLLPGLDERVWMPVGERYLLVDNVYEPAASRLDSTFVFVGPQRTEIKRAHHWVFTVGEICAMLATRGLTTTALYASTDLEPYYLGAPRLLLLAERA